MDRENVDTKQRNAIIAIQNQRVILSLDQGHDFVGYIADDGKNGGYDEG